MNTHMRRFLLLVGIGSLAFSLACGGGGNNGGGFGSGGGTGSFSNASLNGHYAYQIRGYILPSQSPFREAGVFTADGNGHLTNITDDFANGAVPSPATANGSYQINNDGSGTLTINFSDGAAVFAVTLSSSSQFYMVEVDSTFNAGLVASGMGVKQDSSTLTSVPSGTFILRMHNIILGNSSTVSQSTVGAFTVSGGTVSGNMDNQKMTVSTSSATSTSSTITSGAFNTPDATGRGTGTFVDSTNGTLAFDYYIVDSNHLILFNSTPNGSLGLGTAEKQTGGPFTTASFTGPYAFGTSGDTNSSYPFEQTQTVGRFNADGSGAISGGVLDDVTDGITSTNIPFTGTYTVASNGRVAGTLNASGGSIQHVYWMVSPTRAFFVTDSTNSVEDGSLDTQASTLSNATLNGLYAYEMDGFDSALNNTKERVGIMNFNGSGSISVGQIANALGTVNQTTTPLTGTYTVGSNGRVTASVNSLSSNLVFYLVSGSNAYILQNDTGVSIGGTLTKQP